MQKANSTFTTKYYQGHTACIIHKFHKILKQYTANDTCDNRNEGQIM